MKLIMTTENRLRKAIRRELDAQGSPSLTMPREIKGYERWEGGGSWVGTPTRYGRVAGKRGY